MQAQSCSLCDIHVLSANFSNAKSAQYRTNQVAAGICSLRAGSQLRMQSHYCRLTLKIQTSKGEFQAANLSKPAKPSTGAGMSTPPTPPAWNAELQLLAQVLSGNITQFPAAFFPPPSLYSGPTAAASPLQMPK